MIDKVLDTVKRYNMIETNDNIVLGLSGGADSVCLLYVLLELREKFNLNIIATHINHGLREDEAKRDEDFIKNLCLRLNVQVKVFNYPVAKEAKEKKLTIEEAGRLIRYSVFEKVLKEEGRGKIAVAHNYNDQAETVIMNFFRGSGLKGLSGIPPVRGEIIRPLINTPRSKIEEFCKNNNINFVIDSSNNSLNYTRNKIRLPLLSYIMKEFNPSIIDTLSRSAEIFSTEDDYINIQANAAYEKCVSMNDDIKVIDLQEFSLNHEALQRRIVRKIFFSFAGTLNNFSNKHINMVMSMASGNTGKSINLPYNLKIEKSYEKLFISKVGNIHQDYLYKVELGSFFYVNVLNAYISCTQEKVLLKKGFTNTFTKVFNYDKISQGMILRNRKPSDKIYIKSVGHKKVKNYFIDKKIARNERDIIPLLMDNENVMWIMPYLSKQNYETVSETYIAKNTDKNKIYIQLWEENK